MLNTRIALPENTKAGELVEIKTLISHPMNTGFEYDNRGELIPRNILTEFQCYYLGKKVFHARFNPSVAANPYLSFYIKASASGAVEFVWIDQHGDITKNTKQLNVE